MIYFKSNLNTLNLAASGCLCHIPFKIIYILISHKLYTVAPAKLRTV